MASWQPSTEDLRRVITEQNPWQGLNEVPGVLAPPTERPLARMLWRRVLDDEPRRYRLVLGPRRVGKTTVMYQTVRHLLEAGIPPHRLWWLRLDHPLLMEMSLDTLVRVVIDVVGATPDEPAFLFLDEVVYARDWDLWLKTFYDERYPVRIVATSSATAALRDRRLESGVGRWDEESLMPYLLTEYLDLLEVRTELPTPSETLARTIGEVLDGPSLPLDVGAHRRRLILSGGFPELLLFQAGAPADLDEVSLVLGSQRVLRRDAVERAVYKDIPQSFGVHDPLVLERLLYVLAGQFTGILSPKNICRELGDLSQPTFDRYLSYLERAFLVFVLPNYSGREMNVQKRGRVLYFVDPAVRNAALQRGFAPTESPEEMGLLLENVAASHLHSLALQTHGRLFHWRGRGDVDLIYDHPEHPLAFEIGSSVRHKREGLRALVEQHPRFAGRAYLVAPDALPISPNESESGVGTLPLDLLLLLLGRQSEKALADRL